MSSHTDPSVMAPADAVLHAADKYALKLATVESCTGGLLSAVLMEIERAAYRRPHFFQARPTQVPIAQHQVP
ncbi:MAG: CinA family protein [Alphaproteobacteria bacterium]|nr:CinA family protein [Alphaproteobacteria bacterium]